MRSETKLSDMTETKLSDEQVEIVVQGAPRRDLPTVPRKSIDDDAEIATLSLLVVRLAMMIWLCSVVFRTAVLIWAAVTSRPLLTFAVELVVYVSLQSFVLWTGLTGVKTRNANCRASCHDGCGWLRTFYILYVIYCVLLGISFVSNIIIFTVIAEENNRYLGLFLVRLLLIIIFFGLAFTVVVCTKKLLQAINSFPLRSYPLSLSSILSSSSR